MFNFRFHDFTVLHLYSTHYYTSPKQNIYRSLYIVLISSDYIKASTLYIFYILDANKDQPCTDIVTCLTLFHDRKALKAGKATRYKKRHTFSRGSGNTYSRVIRQRHQLCLSYVKHSFASANGVANTILFTSIYAFPVLHFIRDSATGSRAINRFFFSFFFHSCYAGLKVQSREDERLRLLIHPISGVFFSLFLFRILPIITPTLFFIL